MDCQKLVFALACMVLFSGCKTHDNHIETKTVIPSYYSTNSTKISAARANADSQQLIGQTKLDLAMLIDIACENNPSVKRAWHAARAERARAKKANSAFYPTIVLSGMLQRTEANTPIQAQHTVQKSVLNSISPGVEMHYSLFKFGGTVLSADAARYALYAANYQFDRALQTVVHEVESAYFRLSSAEQTVIAKRNNLEDSKGTYEAAFTRHQSGLTNIQEYLQAKASKAQAEFELEQALANVESARAALAQLLGVKVSNDIEIIHPMVQKNLQEVDRSIDDLMTEVVRTRPDVKAAYAQVVAKEKLTKSVKRNLLPEFVVGGSGARTKYQHFKGQHNSFNVFAGLQWEIFDGFRNFYDIIEARENAKIARAEFEQRKLQAQSEVWTYYFSLKSAFKQLGAARKYVASAEESFLSMVISYKNGLCKFTDLLSAQSCLANAREQLISSENNLLMAVSNLAYSTGGIVGSDLMNKQK